MRMRQSEINELKDLAFHKAREFPCEQLLNEAGYMTRTRGDKIFSQCPNCGKIGKKGDSCITHSMFSITKSKNVFSCFSCDFKGGPATLYAHFNNVSYIEACVILAYRLGDITLEQYESINGSTDAIKKFQGDTKVYRMIDEKISEDYTSKAPDDVCNLVYSHLLRMPQFTLSKEHRKYLLENRHLTEQEINELGFFTYKECFNIDKLILSIRKEYPDFTYNNLLGVPGFFMEYQDESKSLGRWMFKHPCPECIGIPLKNTIGEIMALQMRNLNQKSANKGMKYFYVSSRNNLEFIRVSRGLYENGDMEHLNNAIEQLAVAYDYIVLDSKFGYSTSYEKMLSTLADIIFLSVIQDFSVLKKTENYLSQTGMRGKSALIINRYVSSSIDTRYISNALNINDIYTVSSDVSGFVAAASEFGCYYQRGKRKVRKEINWIVDRIMGEA